MEEVESSSTTGKREHAKANQTKLMSLAQLPDSCAERTCPEEGENNNVKILSISSKCVDHEKVSSVTERLPGSTDCSGNDSKGMLATKTGDLKSEKSCVAGDDGDNDFLELGSFLQETFLPDDNNPENSLLSSLPPV